MRRLFLLLVLLTTGLAILHLGSCRKEPVYSCDKELNDYATQTMSMHQGISRARLAQLGIDTQFAIFNSLSLENKIRIFQEKISVLLADHTVSPADKIHLQALNNYVGTNIYTLEERAPDPFIAAWESQAFYNLHWDSTKMFFYVETWLQVSEFPQFTTDDPVFEGGNSINCKCNSRFACGFGFYSCKTSGCTQTRTGCGIYGSNPCKGVCDY